MDFLKVLLLIKEHGTSLFYFILFSLKINSQNIQFDNNLSACSMEWLKVTESKSVLFLLQKLIGIVIS